jgi:Na+-exporting ATPase
VVFKHAPISWEWGIVFVSAGLFFLGAETWKWCKRIYFRRQARKQSGQVNTKNMDIEDRIFGRYYSTASGDSQESTQEKA